MGMVLVGFYITVNSTMTTGLLESSKEWMIFKMKYNVPERELDPNQEDIKNLLATGEYSLKTAMIAGAMGVSQKDVYIYYMILTQVLCMIFVVFHSTYPKSSTGLFGFFSRENTN